MTKVASEDDIRRGLSLDHSDRKKLQSALEEYKKIPLNICVIGQPGVGKSSFINAIRNIDRKDPDAAPTDTIEMTLKVTPYEAVNNRHVQYWDVPGELCLFVDEFIAWETYILQALEQNNFPKKHIWKRSSLIVTTLSF